MIDVIIIVLAFVGGCFTAEGVGKRDLKAGAFGLALIIVPTVLRLLFKV